LFKFLENSGSKLTFGNNNEPQSTLEQIMNSDPLLNPGLNIEKEEKGEENKTSFKINFNDLKK
jgi:hypothetical protein